MTVALVIVAVTSLASTLVLRLALRDVVRTLGEIDARAGAERHVLAGRIQRPDLFPTAVLAAPGTTPATPTEDPPPQMSGFEAAGQLLDGRSIDELTDLFGPEFTKDAPHAP